MGILLAVKVQSLCDRSYQVYFTNKKDQVNFLLNKRESLFEHKVQDEKGWR